MERLLNNSAELSDTNPLSGLTGAERAMKTAELGFGSEGGLVLPKPEIKIMENEDQNSSGVATESPRPAPERKCADMTDCGADDNDRTRTEYHDKACPAYVPPPPLLTLDFTCDAYSIRVRAEASVASVNFAIAALETFKRTYFPTKDV